MKKLLLSSLIYSLLFSMAAGCRAQAVPDTAIDSAAATAEQKTDSKTKPSTDLDYGQAGYSIYSGKKADPKTKPSTVQFIRLEDLDLGHLKYASKSVVLGHIKDFQLPTHPIPANWDSWMRKLSEAAELTPDILQEEIDNFRQEIPLIPAGDAAFAVKLEQLSGLMLDHEQPELGLEAVEAALESRDDSGGVDLLLCHRKGMLLMELGYPTEAEQWLSKIPLTDGDAKKPRREILCLQGRICRERHALTLDREHARDGMAFYHDAFVVMDEQDVYSGAQAVHMSLLAGDLDNEKELLDTVLALSIKETEQDDASYWDFFSLGELYVLLGKEDEAIAAYQAASDLNPPPRDLTSATKGLRRTVTGLKNVIPWDSNYDPGQTGRQIEALLAPPHTQPLDTSVVTLPRQIDQFIGRISAHLEEYQEEKRRTRLDPEEWEALTDEERAQVERGLFVDMIREGARCLLTLGFSIRRK